MAWKLFLLSCSVIVLSAACSEESREEACLGSSALANGGFYCPEGDDLARYVDPMIGTAGSGNSVPAALVPHGMVKLSPDTNGNAGAVDAYEYRNDKIEGFTHTQLQGPGGGANGYSHILLMPTTGPLETDTATYASSFSHDAEEASPGYYAVTLDDYAIRAELTATAHAGFHRYTFPQADEARVLIDLGHSLGESKDGRLHVVDDRTVEGSGTYSVHPLLTLVLSANDAEHDSAITTVYFSASFNRAFASHGTWKRSSDGTTLETGTETLAGPKIGAFLSFKTSEGDIIEARVGISLVSVEQARLNRDTEVGSSTFDEVEAAAREAWNCRLRRMQVESKDVETKTIFYTALYHTLFHPADYSEVGGVFFTGADGKGTVLTWPDRHYYTDDWCLWDTFRTSRPLATLVEPETVDDLIASYLLYYELGGWLPKCPWHATGYSRVMIGNHAVPVIADAMTKGFTCYDTETAWNAVHKSATEEDLRWLLDGICGYINLGTPPEYIENGYVSTECDPGQSVSMTLEYAYNDWTTALVARELGRGEDFEYFLRRSKNYENHWNPEVGFMQARRRDGSWVLPFDPADDSDFNDFTEASSWIYTWFVPHDVAGLIELVGGDSAFVEKLDEYFDNDQHDPSNEPGFHTPYLYNYAGAAARAQSISRSLLDSEFSAEPNGLPGNDDSGATSAWYVFAALGLYPVAPGDGIYQIASPIFDRAILHLNPVMYAGDSFTIETSNGGPENVYVQSATLNGQPLTRPWIAHTEIVAGGTLHLEMGPSPSDWGSDSKP